MEFRRKSGAWARSAGAGRKFLRALYRLRRARRAAAREVWHLVLGLVFSEGIVWLGGVCDTLCGFWENGLVRLLSVERLNRCTR